MPLNPDEAAKAQADAIRELGVEACQSIVAAATLWVNGDEAGASEILGETDAAFGFLMVFGMWIGSCGLLADIAALPVEQILQKTGLAAAQELEST